MPAPAPITRTLDSLRNLTACSIIIKFLIYLMTDKAKLPFLEYLLRSLSRMISWTYNSNSTVHFLCSPISPKGRIKLLSLIDVDKSFLLLISAGRPQFLCRFGTSSVLTLPHHLLLIHFLRIVDVNIRSFLFCYVPLLLLVVIEYNAQVLQHSRWYLIPKVFNRWGYLVQIQLKDIVLTESRIVIPTRYSKSPFAA